MGRNAWSHLTSTVRIEMVGMLVVIGLTGVLVNQVPARTAAGIGTIYSQTKELTPTHNTVNLVVDPNRVGANAIHMYILDATGRTVDAPNGVTVKISFPAQSIGPFERKADQGGPGHYLLVGNTDLSTAGPMEDRGRCPVLQVRGGNRHLRRQRQLIERNSACVSARSSERRRWPAASSS